MKRRQNIWLLAAFGALASGGVLAADEKAPTAPVIVEAAAADAYPRVSIHVQAPMLSADGRGAGSLQRDWKEPVFPDPGQALVFAVKATKTPTVMFRKVSQDMLKP